MPGTEASPVDGKAQPFLTLAQGFLRPCGT